MDAFKEAIRSGLEEYLQALRRAIDGLPPAEVRWQTTLNTNHIAWLVWHMARVEDSWVNRVLSGNTQVWKADGWSDRFAMDPEETGFGQTSDEVRTMPEISLKALMEYFDAVRAVTHRYLDSATDGDILQEYSHRGSDRTGIWIVGHILVEESQHTGQIALIRGLIRGHGG